MPEITYTQAAREHQPIGDPEHVAYGCDYYWQCSCGRSAPTLTDKDTAAGRGRSHAKHCEGSVEVHVA